MNQMAKGLLFGAAVLSQTAAGCFSAAAASIDRVRIRLAAEELDEMGMPVLEAESRDRAYSVTGVERISGDPASGPAMDGAEVGKKENEQYKGSIQADSENIGTKEVSLEERKIEEIHAEEPAPEILYEIELESDADDSFSVLRQEDIQFSGLGAVCSKAVRKDNGTTLLLTIELQDAGEIIGTVDAADWEKRGIGRWKKAPEAEAAQNREEWGGKKPGWQPEGEIPSYILKDGAYPQMDSLLIGEKYEQFNEKGENVSRTVIF